MKPALSYLDVVRERADAFDLPLCACFRLRGVRYDQGGPRRRAGDERRSMCETALSVFRAGADMPIACYVKHIPTISQTV